MLAEIFAKIVDWAKTEPATRLLGCCTSYQYVQAVAVDKTLEWPFSPPSAA